MRTRNQTRQELQSSHQNMKRSAIESPGKAPQRKRSAFGDLTNAISNNLVIDSNKKNGQAKKPISVNKKQPKRSSGGKRGSLTRTKDDLAAIPEEVTRPPQISRSRSGSAEASSVPSSTFSSPADDSEIEYHKQGQKKDLSQEPVPAPTTQHTAADNHEAESTEDEGEDFDKENIKDPFHVPHYSRDIFNYYRAREEKFKIGDYLPRQPTLSRQMRAILVDWMVEIQENFELNHETLYQAVKITDLYLDREIVSKENLQLVGSTALFIASKFDERQPPCCDDFLYICDDAYSKEELFECERKMLITLDFDIGMPLSYRYVRRYAKTSKVGMDTLTLSRYVLETSLMFYDFVSTPDSQLAAAAFLLALRMKNLGDWTKIQEKYSGYKLEEVEPLMWRLNGMLKHPPPAKNVKTVLNKYSHEVFFEVAKIPPLEGGIFGVLDRL